MPTGFRYSQDWCKYAGYGYESAERTFSHGDGWYFNGGDGPDGGDGSFEFTNIWSISSGECCGYGHGLYPTMLIEDDV
jgi:hypothetical protein